MNANEMADKLEKPMLDNPECPNFSRTRAFMEQVVAMLRQQQAEIEALKLQLHTTLTNRNLEKPAVEDVMAEHCTCYKLGYSPLNDYALVKQK